jgi:hypothetical protein
MAEGQENLEATTVTASTITAWKQKRNTQGSKVPSHWSKALASASRCTPKQLNFFHAELKG